VLGILFLLSLIDRSYYKRILGRHLSEFKHRFDLEDHKEVS